MAIISIVIDDSICRKQFRSQTNGLLAALATKNALMNRDCRLCHGTACVLEKAPCREALISHDSTVEDNAGTICGDPVKASLAKKEVVIRERERESRWWSSVALTPSEYLPSASEDTVATNNKRSSPCAPSAPSARGLSRRDLWCEWMSSTTSYSCRAANHQESTAQSQDALFKYVTE